MLLKIIYLTNFSESRPLDFQLEKFFGIIRSSSPLSIPRPFSRDGKSKEIYGYINQLIYHCVYIDMSNLYREKYINIFDISEEIYGQINHS